MLLTHSFKSSLALLSAQKTRSFITMLGIIIGVASVIIIMAVGAGAQNLVLAQVKSLGANLIGILPGKSDDSGPPTSVMGIIITSLKEADLNALKNKGNVPNLIDAVGYLVGAENTSWDGNSYDTTLKGITSGYLNVEGGELDQGRFITEEEQNNLAKVVVLGSTVKQELFGLSDAIGERIKIKKQSFEVVGTMKERGTVAFQNYDDQILLPLKTMQKIISGVDYLGMIRAKIDNEKNTVRAIQDIEITLRDQHNISDRSGANDDFTVRSASQALEMITTITNSLRFFLAAVAALSLIVGGIGIMNIMLMNVKQRTREIGLRKALGANNRHILTQFIMETILITGIGGIIGIAIGVMIAFVISLGAGYLGYKDWIFVISPFYILLSLSVSGLVGLIFGLYPALKASKLAPVEALRYE